MKTARMQMETLIGYLLLGGVLSSAAFLLAATAWNLAAGRGLSTAFALGGVNLVQFLVSVVRELAAGAVRPHLLLRVGILLLVLTPYVRVLASMLFFAAVEHDVKYALFTGVVLGVLTFSLLLR
jgi:uncharacterized membrane protein